MTSGRSNKRVRRKGPSRVSRGAEMSEEKYTIIKV